MGRVSGKVAFVTGAARGQGRSHAVRLAEEGADIIAVDLCENVDTIGYPMATPDDLDETAAFVEKTGRRIVTPRPTCATLPAARRRSKTGIAELGGLDIVVAQAGIAGMKGEPPLQAWTDVINTNLIGTINAIHVALPHLNEGASIVATGSTAALMDAHSKPNPGGDPGGMAYMFVQAAAVAVRPRPRHRAGGPWHPRQRGAPDELQHRHAAEPADVQVVPPGPGEPHPRRRRARLRRPAGDEGPRSSSRRTSATPSCGSSPTRPATSPACSCGSTPAATSSGTTTTPEPTYDPEFGKELRS